MRWDGRSWQADTTPGLPDVRQCSAVSAVSADDVWAYGVGNDGQALVHYDGDRWSSVPTVGDGATWTKQAGALAPDAATSWPSYAFNDLAPAGDSGSFWAVGDYKMPMDEHSDTKVTALIERSTAPKG